jgi:hypothetical protein
VLPLSAAGDIDRQTRLMVYSGCPDGEPIDPGGPFVMNSPDEWSTTCLRHGQAIPTAVTIVAKASPS